MLSKDGRGLMNDWDHSRPLLEQLMEMLQTYRTVSIVFMILSAVSELSSGNVAISLNRSFTRSEQATHDYG